MSEQNVEFVKGLFAATAPTNKDEFLAALPQLIAQACHPDVEWVEASERFDSQTYHGHEGVRQSLERWLDAWDEYGVEPDRLVDCGDDVFVAFREIARGQKSGANITLRNYAVFTMREGKLARYQEFLDEQPALKAVGLEA